MGSWVHGQGLELTGSVVEAGMGRWTTVISSSLNATGALANITKWCALRAMNRRALWPGESEEAWVELRT